MPWREANAGTPPTWSECSWVTTMASRESGATPMRASRAAVSRTPNPQSIMMRVEPASTTSPLPSLPLPIEAKRINDLHRFALLELVLEQREDLLARRRFVGDAARILHADDADRGCLGNEDLILLGLV